MTPAPSAKKTTLFSRLFKKLGSAEWRDEISRLEAFVAAAPGAYCGWSLEGEIAYSRGFADLLGLPLIRVLADVQARLMPADAAALEGLFTRLQDEDEPFALTAVLIDNSRVLRLSGRTGRDSRGFERFDAIWAEDVTAQTRKAQKAEADFQQMRDESARLNAVFDHVPQPLWMRGDSGALAWCNRAYACALGISPAAVVAEQRELPTTAGVSHKGAKGARPGDTPLRDLARQALASGKPQEAAVHIVSDGRRRLMRVREIPLPREGRPGATTALLGLACDITREEEIEAEFRRSSSSYRELLEQLRTAIALYDANQHLEFYNAAFSQLWGLDDRWLNARPKLGDLMEKLREGRRLPEQADFRKYKQSWLSLFTGLIGAHEDMLYLPDGSALRMLVLPRPTGGLMMTFEDVTSRLELESSYNTLIAVQKETLDNLAEGVAVFGSDGRLKLWNPALANLWGLHPEDLAGEPHIGALVDKVRSYFEIVDWSVFRETLVALALDRRERGGRMKRAGGSIVDYATVPLPDGGVLVTWSDVTDKVGVENALREKNAALEAAERLKLDFLANVSYQLRTPLNAIMGFAEILTHEYFGTLNDRQKDYAHHIGEAGGKLLALINDILDLSTIEAGYMTLEKAPMDVRTTLEALLSLTAEWAKKEKVSIALDCPADIGAIEADERRVKQILLNLIRNALAFTPQGGSITLRARRADGAVELTVSDTGIGIPLSDQTRIFEPFERIQGAARPEGKSARAGAGLGLSLVRNIAQLHGGAVVLSSAPGRGTDVTVRLPTEPERAPQAAA